MSAGAVASVSIRVTVSAVAVSSLPAVRVLCASCATGTAPPARRASRYAVAS